MPESPDRGALTEAVFYILLSIYSAPLHGYGIMQNIESLSAGRVKLGAGTLYGALNTLLNKGWIEIFSDDKKNSKKEYEITSLGKEVLERELLRLEELIGNGKKIMGGE